VGQRRGIGLGTESAFLFLLRHRIQLEAHGQREGIQFDNAREREQAKHTGNPNVDQQGNRANVRPIRPDRAIAADHRARARAQPHSSFVMLRAVRVRIEDAARNSQGRCNPQRMGFPPVTAMVAPET
jgi:hypothetical protein